MYREPEENENPMKTVTKKERKGALSANVNILILYKNCDFVVTKNHYLVYY